MENTISPCLWYTLFIFLGMIWIAPQIGKLCLRWDARAKRRLQKKKTEPKHFWKNWEGAMK